jgi:SOS response regulatory protein OraA/RecX
MILQQIRPSKSPEKIYLLFNNGSLLPLKLDDYVLEKLKSGQVITDSLFDRLSVLSLTYLLKNYALRQIAISPKIETVLRPKLNRQVDIYFHKFSFAPIDTQPIIADLIDYLNQKKLLDPTTYASYLINRNPSKSLHYLRQLFSHHHLDHSLLTFSTDDLIKIKKLVDKKTKSLPKPMDFKTKTRLIGFLTRKGFAYSDIKTAIDEIVKVG